MQQVRFDTDLKGFGNNTGIEVPAPVLNELGGGKRPPVKVTVNGYTYQSSVGSMNGKSMISFPKAHREASGLKAGDAITVVLTLESKNREVAIPPVLSAALQQAGLLEKFQSLAYSKRKEFVRQVVDAKAEDTRQRRITNVITTVKEA